MTTTAIGSTPSISTTSSATTGTISEPGVASGLDVNSLITQLMAVDSAPLTILTQQATSYQTKITDLGQIQSAITQLQTAAQGLTTATSNPSYSVQSSNASAVTATAGSGASVGNHSVSVTQLAQSQELVAGGVASETAAIGGGASTTLTINLGTISGGSLNSSTGQYSGATFTANASGSPVTITIGSSNNTLQGIESAINSANAGVTASIVNDGSATPYRLVLTSTATGASNAIQIGVSGDSTLQSLLAYDPSGTQNMSQIQAAQNAQLTADGINVTSSSNTVTDAIQGVTLNLLQPTAGTAQLAVSTDPTTLTNAITALVTAYNGVNTTISGLTGKGDDLQGDSNVETIQRQLQSAFSSMVSNSGIYNSLAAINVSLQQDGTLAVDSASLNAQLASNYSDVVSVVGAFGQSLTSLTANILDPTNGEIQNEINGINSQITNNTNQQTQMNARLASTQATLQAEFSALDVMMASMTSTQNFLKQQFYNTNNNFNTSTSGG